MTEADARNLEAQIGRPLSPPVRHFFLNFPSALRDIAAAADPDGEDPWDDFYLTDDIDGMLAMNADTPYGLRPLDWEPHMLLLGSGGCGETFWVDLGSETGTMYRFESGQEAKDSDHIADSLDEYARRVIGAKETTRPPR